MQGDLTCQGPRHFHEYAEKVFVRLSNIRVSCMAVTNLFLKSRGWEVKYISPREFSMVSWKTLDYETD